MTDRQTDRQTHNASIIRCYYFVEVSCAVVAEADGHEGNYGEVCAGCIELGDGGVNVFQRVNPAVLDAVLADR